MLPRPQGHAATDDNKSSCACIEMVPQHTCRGLESAALQVMQHIFFTFSATLKNICVRTRTEATIMTLPHPAFGIDDARALTQLADRRNS